MIATPLQKNLTGNDVYTFTGKILMIATPLQVYIILMIATPFRK